jgi:serine/threonine protein kinase
MQIGPYFLLGELGSGALGVVHHARGPQGEEVAIKVIKRSSPERDARLLREVQTQAALGLGAGFVPLLSSGSDERHVFLVMPLLAGGSLLDRLRHGPLELDDASDLAEKLADALARAHALGLIHRDIKPANILYDETGRPFLADLGLAKEFGKDSALSVTGQLRGTVGYMAPEQARDAKHVGPASDVFSWGVVMFEAFTGQRPFKADVAIEELCKAKEGRRSSLQDLCSYVPPSLARAIDLALSPAPGDRPRDGSALLEVMREAPPAPTATKQLVLAAVGGATLALVGVALTRNPSPPPSPTPSATVARSTATLSATPATPTPRAATSQDGALAALLEDWPSQASLVPLGVQGDSRGSMGRPLFSLAWESDEVLLALCQGGITRLDVKSGRELAWLAWDLQLRKTSPTVLDLERDRLWVGHSRKAEVWSLQRGEPIGRVSLPFNVARLSLAADGESVALADRTRIALWRLGEKKLSWTKTPWGKAKGRGAPHLAFLPSGELITVSTTLEVWNAAGERTRTIELSAPVGDDGALALTEDRLLLLDSQGQLQEWSFDPWLLRATTAVTPPTPGRQGRKVRRLLVPAGDQLWIGIQARGKAQAWRRSAPEDKLTLEDLIAFAPHGDRIALARGSQRARVELREGSVTRWGDEERALLGPLYSRSGGGAYAAKGSFLRVWSAGAPPRALPGARRVLGGVLPTQDGYFAVGSSNALERWSETGSEPLTRWDREETGPLGGSPLRLLGKLSDESVLGFSRVTLGERRGTTYVLRGQKNLASVFGPGSARRDFDWGAGDAPLLGHPLPDERVFLVTPTRALVLSLQTSNRRQVTGYEHPTLLAVARGEAGYLRLTGAGLELWAWGEERPTRRLALPAGFDPRGLPRVKKGAAPPAGVLACTESYVACALGGQLLIWPLRGGQPAELLRLEEGAQTVCAVGEEIWIGTTRGTLVRSGPKR